MLFPTKKIVQNLITQGNFSPISIDKNSLSSEFSALLQQLFKREQLPNDKIYKYLNKSQLKDISKVNHQINNPKSKPGFRKSAKNFDLVVNVEMGGKYSALESMGKILKKQVEKILNFLETDPKTNTLLKNVKSGDSDLVIPVVLGKEPAGENKKLHSVLQDFLVISYPKITESKAEESVSEPDISLVSDTSIFAHLNTQVIADKKTNSSDLLNPGELKFAFAQRRNANISVFITPRDGNTEETSVAIFVKQTKGGKYTLSGVVKGESLDRLKWQRINSTDYLGEDIGTPRKVKNPAQSDGKGVESVLPEKNQQSDKKAVINTAQSVNKKEDAQKYPGSAPLIKTGISGFEKESNSGTLSLEESARFINIKHDRYNFLSINNRVNGTSPKHKTQTSKEITQPVNSDKKSPQSDQSGFEKKAVYRPVSKRHFDSSLLVKNSIDQTSNDDAVTFILNSAKKRNNKLFGTGSFEGSGQNLHRELGIHSSKGHSRFTFPGTTQKPGEGSQSNTLLRVEKVGNSAAKSRQNPTTKITEYVVINISRRASGDAPIKGVKSRIYGLLEKMNGEVLINENPAQKPGKHHLFTGEKFYVKTSEIQSETLREKPAAKLFQNYVLDDKTSAKRFVNQQQKFSEPRNNTVYPEAHKAPKSQASHTKTESFHGHDQSHGTEKNSANPVKRSDTNPKILRPLDISATSKDIFEESPNRSEKKSLGSSDKKYSRKYNEGRSEYSTVQKSEALSVKPSVTEKVNGIVSRGLPVTESVTNTNNLIDLGFGLNGNQNMSQIMGGVNQAENRAPVIQQVIEKLQSITHQVKANQVMHNAQNIKAQISLKPAHLGAVLLSLRFQENMLHGTIITSTHEAKHSIEKQLPAIRDAVQYQNISLQDIKIEVRADMNQEQRQSFAEQFAREQSGSDHRDKGSSFGKSATTGLNASHEERDSVVTGSAYQVTPGSIEYYA